MRKRLGWCIGAGLAAALLCAACTQTTTMKPAGPGELPTATDSKTPKINATTYFAHAHLLERQGNLEKAVEQYEEALKIQPDFITALNRLGITLNKLGRNADATQRFERAIALAPSAAYLYNNLGFSLYLEGRYDESEAATLRAIELKPDFARARMNLGLTYGKQLRFEEALAAFRAGCDEANAYYNLAVVQSDAKQYTDAVRSLSRALEIDPRLDAARQHMQEITELATAQELAEQLAREQQAFHQQAGALTQTELSRLLGPTPTGEAQLTSAMPTIASPDAVEEFGPPARIETVGECLPPQTEGDFFADEPTIGHSGHSHVVPSHRDRDERFAAIVREIDVLADAAVRGLVSWTDSNCEIDRLLASLVGDGGEFATSEMTGQLAPWYGSMVRMPTTTVGDDELDAALAAAPRVEK